MNQTKTVFKRNREGNVLLLLSLLLVFVLTMPAIASARPVVLYTDILSGPNTGGENNNGAYLSIFGKGFGSSQGSSTVYINGTEVDDYKYWGPSLALPDEIQQITIQPGSAVSSGAIKVVVNGEESNTDHTFTVSAGDIYFVSHSGSDAGGVIGDINNPYRTIQTTWNRSDFDAGDFMVIRGDGGTDWIDNPNNFELQMRKGGSAGSPLTVMGYPGETVNIPQRPTANINTIRALYGPFGHIVLANFNLSNITYNPNGKTTHLSFSVGNFYDMRVVNLDITGANPNALGTIDFAYVDGGKFLGIHLHANGQPGDRFVHAYYIGESNDIEIAWNRIEDQWGGKGIQLRSPAPQNTNFDIHHNIIGDIDSDCLIIGENSGAGIKVYNNIFYNCSRYNDGLYYGNIRIHGIGGGLQAEIFNNTIYVEDTPTNNPNTVGIALGDYDSVVIKNNIIVTNGNHDYYDLGGNPVASNNIYYGSSQSVPSWDTNPIIMNPNFINPTASARDFHLQGGSPAIDAGANVGITDDLDSNSRPQGSGYDIGAYEYASSGSSQPPVNSYYVRPGGSGNGTGPALNQAWGQISQATSNGALSPGDTVYIAPGTYSEDITAVYNFGTSDSARVKYLGDPDADHFPGLSPGTVTLNNDGGMHLWSGTFVNIENLNIIGSGSGNFGGITPVSAQSIIIRNNTIKGYKAGIAVEDQGSGASSDIIIEDNQVIENTQYGIYLWGGATGTIIRNNIIRNNGTQGVLITSSDNEADILNNTFSNNGIKNWGGDSVDHLSINTGFQVTVKNNIFYSSLSGRQTIGEYGAGTYYIDYNLYYSSHGDSINTPGTHSIVANPQFVDTGSNDFHLQSGSLAIDTGVNLTEVTQDMENNSRPLDGNSSGTAETDMGAYEKAGGSPPTTYQCSDGIDNDSDGLTDYPNDPGCTSSTDNNEYNAPPTTYQCSDGVDNDSDGLTDYPNDPGCTSSTDDNEYNAPPTTYQCSDGADNDSDGLTDYPDDPGCTSSTDNNEYNAPPTTYQCSDGIDNDSDGLTDYPDDPGCTSSTDNNEYNAPPTTYQCSDGIDNDSDGLTDYPNDSGCNSSTDNSEDNLPPAPPSNFTITGN